MDKKYCIKLPETIRRMTAIYFTVGLWKTGNGKVSPMQLFYYNLFLAFTLVTFIGIFTNEDKDNSIFLVVIVLILIIQVYRLSFIIGKQNRILDFMHTIGVSSTDDYQTFCIANDKMKKILTLAVSYLGISYTLCVVVVCVPAMKKQLLFDVAFPWDYKTNDSAFWMVYAIIAGTYILSITEVMFVSMIWYMMLVFAVKYDLLATEFRNLGVAQGEARKHDKNAKGMPSKENFYLQDLMQAIKNMDKINDQLEEFESMFSSLFLLQIITSSMCICGTTFVLAFSTHENLLQDAFYFIEIVYCLADIFAVLYLGNEVMLSSDKLSYSLFESNWITQTQSCKKCFLIVVERLKQPREFIVGIFFAMNIETFTLIVNRSFSMFNILRNFQK